MLPKKKNVKAKDVGAVNDNSPRGDAPRKTGAEKTSDWADCYSFFDAFSEGYFRTDSEGRIKAVNKTMVKLLGYESESQIVGSPMVGFFTDSSQQECLLEGIRRDGEALGCEATLVSKGGESVFVIMNSKPVLDSSGNEIGFQGVVHDVTKNKQKEAELIELERRYRLASEASKNGVWDWNLLTGEVFFSPRYFTMLGYEADAFEHHFTTWESLLHPDDKEYVYKRVSEHLEKGEPFDIEFRLRNEAGNWQWIHGRGQIMEKTEDGKPARMVGTHTNIDDRVRATQGVRARYEELKALNILSTSLIKSLSVDELVSITLEKVHNVISPDMTIMFLAEGNIIATKGVKTTLPNIGSNHFNNRKIGECLCGIAFQKSSAVFSNDMRNDERCSHGDCTLAGIQSFASVPLLAEGKSLGILGVGSREKRDFSKDSSFLESVCAIISSGLTNANLHEGLKRYSENLEFEVEKRTAELRKFQNAIVHSSTSIIITDATGKIEYVNPFFTTLTGFSAEEVIGENPRVLKSSYHDGQFYEDMWSTLVNGATWRGEICNRKKDGTLYWENVTISPLRDDLGNITHYVAVKEDITRRKAKDEEIWILSKAIKNAASSVIVTDTKGTIVYVNPSFTTMSGYSPEEAVGAKASLLKSGEHGPEVYKELWRDIKNGKTWGGELINKRKDGSRYWISARISPVFDDKGNITNYVGVQNDISEQKELEILKGDVDRMMRHDLKTPLNAIINLPDLVKQEGNINEDQRIMIDAIERSAYKMLRMIDLSLDLFKIERGSYEYRPVQVDLIEIVEDIFDDVWASVSSKKATCLLRVNDEEPSKNANLIILSNKTLLISLLTNLISNAIEASPRGDTILVDTQLKDACVISIHNNGVVPPPVRQSFFEKYKTYGKTTGTGLGTYTARLLAGAMGYKIEMETSDEKNETVLRVTVPRGFLNE